MLRSTYALIDLKALRNNIQNIKGHLKPGVKLMAVIKANAYGHGIVQVGHTAAETGAEYLGVSIPEEGMLLRENNINCPIMVLGGILPEQAGVMIEHGLIPSVFSRETIAALQNAAEKNGTVHPVHIKTDTGMNRIGIKTKPELKALLEFLKDCPNLVLEGLFTHFAVSEAEDKTFTNYQAQKFLEFADMAKQAGFSPMLHASNSGAMLELKDLNFDMVRCGLSMYGYYTAANPNRFVELEPVMTWKSTIVHIKEAEANETVSYGRTYTVKQPVRIATIPVGYGDGYKRCLSNTASVLIGGKRAPVLGRVCMDQLMCDITQIKNVNIGDEAVLIGRQGNERIDANEMARWADTISYEILLSVSERVPRVYI